MNKSKTYMITASVVLCLLLAIIIVVNIFIGVLSNRVNLKIDLSPDKVLTFSDETKEILSNLDTDINIYSLIPDDSKNTYHIHMRSIIEKFDTLSSKINYTVIDAEENPDFVSKYKLNGHSVNNNCIIFESNKRYKVVDTLNALEQYKDTTYIKAEKMFLSAVVNVVSQNDVKIGVVTGHGEQYDSSFFNELLIDSGYYTIDIDLGVDEIPDDVNMLIMTSPETDYNLSEIEKVDAFADEGNSLQVILSPGVADDSVFASYIKEWGIDIIPDLIVENDSNYYNTNPSIIYAQLNTEHEITRDISARNMKVMLIGSCAFEKNTNQYIVEDVLLTTTDKGSVYGKTSAQKKFNLASVLEKNVDNGKKSRMFVSGSLGLLDMSNDLYNTVANGDFYNNVISYLSDNDEYISIRPKNIAAPYVAMSAFQLLFFGLIVVIVIPVAILVFGILVWLRRRRL